MKWFYIDQLRQQTNFALVVLSSLKSSTDLCVVFVLYVPRSFCVRSWRCQGSIQSILPDAGAQSIPCNVTCNWLYTFVIIQLGLRQIRLPIVSFVFVNSSNCTLPLRLFLFTIHNISNRMHFEHLGESYILVKIWMISNHSLRLQLTSTQGSRNI